MNEFIVWHKLIKEFVLPHKFLVFDDNGVADNDDCIICNYIGLKDTNNNKIYADSSIFELENFPYNYKAYFTYSEYYLGYCLVLLRDGVSIEASTFPYCPDTMSNFKIIDTIQENKLGLINE